MPTDQPNHTEYPLPSNLEKLAEEFHYQIGTKYRSNQCEAMILRLLNSEPCPYRELGKASGTDYNNDGGTLSKWLDRAIIRGYIDRDEYRIYSLSYKSRHILGLTTDLPNNKKVISTFWEGIDPANEESYFWFNMLPVHQLKYDERAQSTLTILKRWLEEESYRVPQSWQLKITENDNAAVIFLVVFSFMVLFNQDKETANLLISHFLREETSPDFILKLLGIIN